MLAIRDGRCRAEARARRRLAALGLTRDPLDALCCPPQLAKADLRVMLVVSARPFEDYFETVPRVSIAGSRLQRGTSGVCCPAVPALRHTSRYWLVGSEAQVKLTPRGGRGGGGDNRRVFRKPRPGETPFFFFYETRGASGKACRFPSCRCPNHSLVSNSPHQPSHSRRDVAHLSLSQEFTALRDMSTVVEMEALSPAQCLMLATAVIGESTLKSHEGVDLLPAGSDKVLHVKSGGGNPLFVRNIAIVSARSPPGRAWPYHPARCASGTSVGCPAETSEPQEA